MKIADKRKNIRTGSFVSLIFVLIYIPSLLHWIYGSNIRTDMIRMGTIEDSVTAFGYIIRDSTVYKSGFEGKCIPEVGEGERVPVNFRIATILNKSSFKLLEMLEEKNFKIIEAQSEKNGSQGLFSHDIQKIDDSIGKKVKLLAREINMNVISSIMPIGREIKELVGKKAAIIGGLTTSDAYINALKNEREKLNEEIKKNTKDIISGESGIVSYIVDGYEETLTSEALRNLTPQVLEQITYDTPVQDIKKRDIYIDKPFAKIIRENDYYIAVILGRKEAELFNEGDIITLRLNDIGKETECKITYKSGSYDGKYIIAIKIDRFMSDTSCLRKVSVDLVRNMHKGLKVPLKSLTNIDLNKMKAKITLVRFNCAAACEVKLDGTDDEFAVISSMGKSNNETVSLYETYIVNPKNIEEGQIIRQ